MKGFASSTLSHGRAEARVRFGVAIWLLALGLWRGVLLVATAALHFYLGYRLLHSVPA
jgi:hypothetical protein